MKSIVHTAKVYDLPYIADASARMGSYVDLRRNPDQISRIPELRDQPVLKELVQVLNAKDGMFMSHGCAFARRKPEGYGVAIPVSEDSATASHWCSSYVVFSFWRFSQNNEQAYQQVYDQYCPEGKGSDVCFVIEPAYFLSLFEQRCDRKWGERNATVCLIWVSGWGEAPAVAHSRWRNAVKSLTSFLGGFQMADAQTTSGGMSVSDLMLSLDRTPPPWAD